MTEAWIPRDPALDIPRSNRRRLANMHATEVSAWPGEKLTFSQEKIGRISQVITDIEKVATVMPMKVDVRDPENVKCLIVAVNDTELQFNLPLADAPLLDFSETLNSKTAD